MAFSFSLARTGRTLRLIGEAVIFRHTVFSFPIAISAILLESAGRPPLWETALILIAATAGRNAANAMNRIIDANIDKKNPRTAQRHLPTGSLSKKTLALFTIVMIVLLIISAALLNTLCVFLLPLAGVLIFGYSYTKRFTWLCHYWLGIACAIAPMGAFVALAGRFEFRFFVLAAAHMLWVAGFDIIYAQLDIEFDRREGLHSIPARFGPAWSRAIAALSHLGTIAAWLALPLFWPLSPWYYAAAGAAAALLVAEHVVALGRSERRIKIASYSINEIVPLAILAGVALGVYL
ncbi:MAG: putative 4-hydroxybenzoate polyprenyltransferase [Treponema sp.]|nr:putative 4-hydroxybenzoate polyprenyltransferase [Treponema sp.]